MAITLKSNSVGTSGFIANGYSADLSGCETLVAAVSGKTIIVESITINSNTAINYTIGDGETGGAVTAVLIGPIYCAANSTQSFVFPRGLRLTAATALVVDASGAGAATVIAQGRIE